MLLYILMLFGTRDYLLFEYEDTIHDAHAFEQAAEHLLAMLGGKLLLLFQHRNQSFYLLSKIITQCNLIIQIIN